MENPSCPHCGRPMQWEPYLLSPRPDALRGGDERAPVAWAWHCRCGVWVYGPCRSGAARGRDEEGGR